METVTIVCNPPGRLYIFFWNYYWWENLYNEIWDESNLSVKRGFYVDESSIEPLTSCQDYMPIGVNQTKGFIARTGEYLVRVNSLDTTLLLITHKSSFCFFEALFRAWFLDLLRKHFQRFFEIRLLLYCCSIVKRYRSRLCFRLHRVFSLGTLRNDEFKNDKIFSNFYLCMILATVQISISQAWLFYESQQNQLICPFK